MIGGKSALLTILNNDAADMDSIITTFNTTVTETANKIIDIHGQKKMGQCTNSLIYAMKEEN